MAVRLSQALGVMNELSRPLARFGSEVWLEAQLLDLLVQARKAKDAAFRANAKLAHSGVDYDHYIYLRVARKQRKVWILLERLAQRTSWLQLSREEGILYIAPSEVPVGIYAMNGEAAAARAAAEVLNGAGIAATVDEHWR